MKLGETLNGYTIVTEPSNQSGGNCVWAFAEKKGKRWFIKEFLKPKYPMPSSPGSEKSKAVRRRNCEVFENRHLTVMKLLNPKSPGGGNLVTASDFFRCDSTYFKVTEPIHHEPGPPLHELEPRRAAVIMKTLMLSVRLLHDQEIVHSDLKPSNILVQAVPGASGGLVTSKLIDFDDAYFERRPPSRDAIGGDPRYAPPEWFQYGREDPAVSERDLTCASDIFALGLVMHYQLVGAQPSFDERSFEGCAGLAVLAGQPLRLADTIHPEMRTVIASMLDREPGRRPPIESVIKSLTDNQMFARFTAVRAEPERAAPAGTSRVKISIGRKPPPMPEPAPEAAPPGTRIRKNFRPRPTRGE